MTYAEASAQIRRVAFPQGEARNLKDINKIRVLDGFLDLQRWLPRMIRRQFKQTEFRNTFYNCGSTIIKKPDHAKIRRLYTITSLSHCDAVFYRPVDKATLEQYKLQRARCGCDFLPCAEVNDGYAESDANRGIVVAGSGFDKGWRSSGGIYAIIEDEIHIYPSIESLETIVLEFSGKRYSFADSDIVDWDRDILRALEFFVKWDSTLWVTCNQKDYLAFGQRYTDLRSDLIVQDRSEDMVDDQDDAETCCDVQWIATRSAEDPDCCDKTLYNWHFKNLEDARSSVIPCGLIGIKYDVNGNSGWFEEAPIHFIGEDDGGNAVADVRGKWFVRRSHV